MFKDVGNFDIWHFYNFYSWTGKNKDIRAVFSQYLFWCFILHSLIPEHLCLPGAVWRVVPVDLHSSDVVRFWMEHHLTLALKQTTFLHSVVGSHTIPIMVQCGGHHFKLTWNTQKNCLEGSCCEWAAAHVNLCGKPTNSVTGYSTCFNTYVHKLISLNEPSHWLENV